MTATFLCTLNISGDTDLLGIADELKQIISGEGSFDVLKVEPWHRDTLPPTGQAPLVAPAN